MCVFVSSYPVNDLCTLCDSFNDLCTLCVAIANILRAGLQAIALAFASKTCLLDGRYRRPLSIHNTLEPSEEKRSKDNTSRFIPFLGLSTYDINLYLFKQLKSPLQDKKPHVATYTVIDIYTSTT